MSTECHEQGTVEEMLPDGRARVRVTRADACGHCAARGACGVFGSAGVEIRLTLDNSVGAAPGDRVTLTLPASVLFRISATVYLVPAVLLILGAVMGGQVLQETGRAEDVGAIIGALMGLGIGLLCTWILGHRLRKSPTLIPRITAVAKSGHTREEVPS